MKKIRFLMLFFLTVFSVAAWAQTEVAGVVLDDANFPLPGVNVLVKLMGNALTKAQVNILIHSNGQ